MATIHPIEEKIMSDDSNVIPFKQRENLRNEPRLAEGLTAFRLWIHECVAKDYENPHNMGAMNSSTPDWEDNATINTGFYNFLAAIKLVGLQKEEPEFFQAIVELAGSEGALIYECCRVEPRPIISA
jgi:hypothetical protein